jgi:hypothetical protein
MSDQPGQVFLANVPNQSVDNWMMGSLPNQIESMYAFTQAIAAYGACFEQQWRPIDPMDYNFQQIGNNGAVQPFQGTMPTILYDSVPAGRSVTFEAIIHYEYQLKWSSSAAAQEINSYLSTGDLSTTPAAHGTQEQVSFALTKAGFDTAGTVASRQRFGVIEPTSGVRAFVRDVFSPVHETTKAVGSVAKSVGSVLDKIGKIARPFMPPAA